MKALYAFLGGAVIGVGAAMLLAPEKGEDVRCRIKHLLNKKGLLPFKENLEKETDKATDN